MNAGLNEAQLRTVVVLRELLDMAVAGDDYRLDPNDSGGYELRLNGHHWGFISIGSDGSIVLI